LTPCGGPQEAARHGPAEPQEGSYHKGRGINKEAGALPRAGLG
jgi:hypothetical protein